MSVVSRPLSSFAGPWLRDSLAGTRWETFRCSVAFLNSSGANYFAPDLHHFVQQGGEARVSVGVDSQGTTLEGVEAVWQVLHQDPGAFHIVHEGTGGRGSFHPKVYLFESQSEAQVYVGSANLTAAGLFRNHELGVVLEFADLQDATLQSLRAALDAWQTTSPTCHEVTAQLIRTLNARGDLPSESDLAKARRAAKGTLPAARNGTRIPDPFGHSPRPSAPPPPTMPQGLPAAPVSIGSGAAAHATQPPTPQAASKLVMEVVPHHNGEVFLSKRAINDDPAFFGHPFAGWTVPKNAGNKPYPRLDPAPLVDIRVYDQHGSQIAGKTQHLLYVVEYSRKGEVRMTIPEGIPAQIPPMSTMVMTKDPTATLDYLIEFFHPNHVPAHYTQALTTAMPRGGGQNQRHYGWI